MGSQQVWLHQNGLSVSVAWLGVSVVASYGCDSVVSGEALSLVGIVWSHIYDNDVIITSIIYSNTPP